MAPSAVTSHRFRAPDGVDLVWHEVGEGRPIVLLHGLFSNAHVNWIKYGHAALLGDAGFRVVMPDLRAHGESAAPHDPAAYPRDVLARDGLALVAHLCLDDYDLGGYSMGARTTLRMVLNGAVPRRLLIAGMGLEGLLDSKGRTGHFKRILSRLGTFERGSPEWMAEAFLKSTGGDPEALSLLLDSFVNTSEADLATIVQPTLVVAGVQDRDNGSSEALSERLPNAVHREVPGNHMSAVTKPELGRAMLEFLKS